MIRTLKIIALLAAILLPAAVRAQEAPYKFDVGAAVGMSGYLGDVNQSNLFKHPGIAASGRFGYVINSRMAIRGLAGYYTLSGNSADFSNVFPDGKVYDFKSSVVDLVCRYEFNFFPYGIGETYKRLRRWSPYLALGVGGAVATAKGGGTAATFVVPMTFGVKYKLAERVNMALEFTMTKSFGDRIDGPLDDLYTIESSFLKNTDWYSGITIGLSYEFGKRCETCNRID